MNKRWCRAFVTVVFFAVLVLETNKESDEESSSQKRNNAYCQESAERYSAIFGCDFKVITKETENKIKGVWQVKEGVGFERSDKEHMYSRMIGHIYIFSEDAWIKSFPTYRPVYYCYGSNIGKMSSEGILDVEWENERYKYQNGILVIAVNPEGYKYKDYEDRNVPTLILVGKEMIVYDCGEYFRLEKVAELETQEDFFDY